MATNNVIYRPNNYDMIRHIHASGGARIYNLGRGAKRECQRHEDLWSRDQNTECVERKVMGGVPLLSRYRVWGRVVSSSRGVLGGAQAQIDCSASSA